MLQANKHISLVCGEPGSLSTFNIILLWEAFTVYHSLSLIKQCLCDTSSCVPTAQSPDIRIWCQIATQGLRLLGTGSGQLSVHSSQLRPVLSQLQGAYHLSFSQSWATLESCHPLPGAPDPWHVSQLPRAQLTHTDTDHYNVLAWVSPRDWRRWELSGGQGRVYTCTLTAALYCGLYNVNGKFYYSSNTSLLNLCVIVANTFHIYRAIITFRK